MSSGKARLLNDGRAAVTSAGMEALRYPCPGTCPYFWPTQPSYISVSFSGITICPPGSGPPPPHSPNRCLEVSAPNINRTFVLFEDGDNPCCFTSADYGQATVRWLDASDVEHTRSGPVRAMFLWVDGPGEYYTERISLAMYPGPSTPPSRPKHSPQCDDEHGAYPWPLDNAFFLSFTGPEFGGWQNGLLSELSYCCREGGLGSDGVALMTAYSGDPI